MEVTRASAFELAEAIRTGRVRSREVVDAHIAVLERVQPVVNGLVQDRFEAARAEADAADARIAANAGEELPPLLGVPCTIKESLAFTGMPNAAGVVARRDIRATTDATVVRRVLDAGAIPLGVTNTSELCMWIESENRLYGRTRNPYDPSRTVGGSSGGEGACVGAGGSPFGIGSDIGGSIRLPAFFNGVFGHKTSPGIVPNTGEFPGGAPGEGRMLSKGPIARCASDLMPLLRILAGPDGVDKFVQNTPLGDPEAVDLSGLEVVISEDFSFTPISRDMLRARVAAARSLADAGAKLRRVPMKDLRTVIGLYLTAFDDISEKTLAETLVEQGAAAPRVWSLLRRGGPHTVATRLLVGMEALGARLPERQAAKLRVAGLRLAERAAETVGDGVWLHPSFATVAPRHGGIVSRPWLIAPALTFNLLGLPVTQVPLGLDPKGLPLGVQVAGAPGNDHVTIAVALHLEKRFGGWVPPGRM